MSEALETDQKVSAFEGNKDATESFDVSVQMSEGLGLNDALGLTDHDEKMYFALTMGRRLLQETEYRGRKTEQNMQDLKGLLPGFIKSGLKKQIDESRNTAKIYDDFLHTKKNQLSNKGNVGRLNILDKAAHAFVTIGLTTSKPEKHGGLKNINLEISQEGLEQWTDTWSAKLNKIST